MLFLAIRVALRPARGAGLIVLSGCDCINHWTRFFKSLRPLGGVYACYTLIISLSLKLVKLPPQIYHIWYVSIDILTRYDTIIVQYFKPMLVNFNREVYYPDCYVEYLSHPKYHHSDKGCNCVVQILQREGSTRSVINILCLTHNIMCSRTGWEIGWYMGEDSQVAWKRAYNKTRCGICQEYFYPTTIDNIYCETCKKLKRKSLPGDKKCQDF